MPVNKSTALSSRMLVCQSVRRTVLSRANNLYKTGYRACATPSATVLTQTLALYFAPSPRFPSMDIAQSTPSIHPSIPVQTQQVGPGLFPFPPQSGERPGILSPPVHPGEIKSTIYVSPPSATNGYGCAVRMCLLACCDPLGARASFGSRRPAPLCQGFPGILQVS